MKRSQSCANNTSYIQKPYSWIFIIPVILFLLFIQSCAQLPTYHPLPQNLENEAEVAGFPNVRAWGDTYSNAFQQSSISAIKQEKAANHGKLEREIHGLALSGGGQDGAFGAGILYGWTKSGTRPNFKLVTGISTGSLAAPFAFLGPAYDTQLKEAYTTISDKDIYSTYSPISIFLSVIGARPLPSLADNKGLEHLIQKMITADVIKKVAAEHRKGRRLFMGTTQLNAQRLVIWDMGAIANSGNPHALKLFRKIMLASASLPVTFPPQYFDVEARGQKFKEMHVDGGVEVQVMLFENSLKLFSQESKYLNGFQRIRKLYIIRNEKIYPEWSYVKPQMRYIAVKSIDTLTKTQGIGDLYRLYAYAQRDKMSYNLTYIPADFTVKSDSEFDTNYMKALFALGDKMANSGYPWQHYPPGYAPTNLL